MAAAATTPGRPHGERGQALPLAAVLVAAAAAALWVTVQVAGVLIDHAGARTAADAAALAGALGGRPAAVRAVTDNGAELVGYRSSGTIVEVRVRRGRAAATARAERAWVPAVPAAGGAGAAAPPIARTSRVG